MVRSGIAQINVRKALAGKFGIARQRTPKFIEGMANGQTRQLTYETLKTCFGGAHTDSNHRLMYTCA
jgi:hypothetical protein